MYGFWFLGARFPDCAPHMFFLMQIRVIFALPLPVFDAPSPGEGLGSCTSSPTPRSATASAIAEPFVFTFI